MKFLTQKLPHLSSPSKLISRFVTLLIAALILVASSGKIFAQENEILLALVHSHVQAQVNFDTATLKLLTSKDYLEVSPAGELDSREKMLSFYAPNMKKSSPEVTVSDPVVKVFGSTALIIAKLNYSMTVAEQKRAFSMRASYTACKEQNEWKLCSVQYTGIR